jgi:hypothetical protein
MTNYRFDDRACGSGKTYQEIADIVEKRGLYVYAVEKRERMAEIEATIHRLAANADTKITVVRIFSQGQIPEIMADGSLVRTGAANVKVEIEALPTTYMSGHVVVLATHEGLKAANLLGFKLWSLCIDECPSIWDRQRLNIAIGSMAEWFAANYTLKPLTSTSTQREIVIRDGCQAEATRTIAKDDLARAASVFHARVLSDRTRVTTTLSDWSQVVKDGGFEWSSIWSPSQLKAFLRVHILANDFENSVTYRLFRAKWPEIEWTRLERITAREYAMRDVVIRYYALRHKARRGLWNSDQGQRHLRMIAVDLSERVEQTNHIWMCHGRDEALFRHPDPDEGWLAPGIKLSPRQQGSNKFASITSASMFYTSKPDTTDIAMMRELEIDPDFVTQSREREIIYQFATRTSLRDADSTATVHLHVYDREQAEYLAAALTRSGYCRPTLELVDLGFADYVHDSKPGRRKVERSTAEMLADAAKKKAQARLRKQRQRRRAQEDA